MSTSVGYVNGIVKTAIACAGLSAICLGSSGLVAAPEPGTPEAVSKELATPHTFEDPLDLPAGLRTSVASRPMMAFAHAGDKLVVAGMRGLVAVSGDSGRTWRQSLVPVQTDLLSVVFPTALNGWAVGHQGVILHSTDGGGTWVKQLDGRLAATRLAAIYERRIAAGEKALQPALDQLQLNLRAGPTLPFLSVWFEDATRGFAVGAFGMIVATEDGGKTWQPWLDRIDNKQFLHLNAVRGIGDDIFIVAEKGTIFKLSRKTGRFDAIPTQNLGSFFGIVGNSQVLLAYGLRGAVYRSLDRGATWNAANVPLQSLITGATYDDATERFVFVTLDGHILLCNSYGRQFRLASLEPQQPLTSVGLAHNGALIVVGLNGVRSISPR